MAEEKLRAAGAFDPVAMRFNDDAAEKAFQRKRVQDQLVHGKDFSRRWPARIRDSEGMVYNIVSMDVMRPHTLARKDQRANRNVVSKAAAQRRHHALQRARDRAEHSKFARRVNKVSMKRETDITHRGYDVITGQPFRGLGGKPRPKPSRPQQHREKTVWQRATMAQLKVGPPPRTRSSTRVCCLRRGQKEHEWNEPRTLLCCREATKFHGGCTHVRRHQAMLDHKDAKRSVPPPAPSVAVPMLPLASTVSATQRTMSARGPNRRRVNSYRVSRRFADPRRRA